MFSNLTNLYPIIGLTIATVLNMLLLLYDRYIDLPIDLELSHISSILMTINFGLGWGIATAIITKLAAMINNVDFTMLSPLSIFSYVLAAVLTYLLLPIIGNIRLLSILIIFISNIISYLIMRNILNVGISSISYNITNIMFNLVIINAILH